MKLKKVLPFLILLILLLGTVMVWKMRRSKKTVSETPKLKKRKITEPVNVIALDERPYITLSPVADNRHIVVTIKLLKKDAESVDYELEYQSGSLIQMIMDSLELDKLPQQDKQLLGSCSAGGSCTYHKDITGGHLTTRFNGPKNYALKSAWKYIENTTKDDAFSSQDAKFQLTSPELSKVRLAIIFNTPGYPEELKKTPVSDFYSLQTVPQLKNELTLTMRAKEEGEFVIMGWDGQTWHEFTGKITGKSITATVEPMELYLLAK